MHFAKQIFHIFILACGFAAPFTVILSLPPFYTGIWVQVEAGSAYLQIVGAIGFLGLAGLCLCGSHPAVGALLHPLTLIPFSIAVLSVLLLPWVAMPGVSYFGAPEHRIGAVTFLELSALTAVYIYLFGESRCRTWLAVVILGLVAAVYGLDFFFREIQSWAPYFFGDYLAFFAASAFVVVAASFANTPVRLSALLVILLVLIVMSGNKAALLAITVGGTIWVLLRMKSGLTRQSLATVGIIMPILVTGTIMLAGPLFQESFRIDLREQIGFPPLSDILISTWASLWSRAMLNFIVIWEVLSDPIILLKGLGWGHFNEALLANLTLVDGRLHELIGDSRVYWDAIRRNDFHSHNQYLETLLSLGIVGLVFFLVYFWAAIYFAHPKRLWLSVFIILLLSVLQSFWFQMPPSVPLMAAAFASLQSLDRSNEMRPVLIKSGAIVSLAASFILVLGAWSSLKDSRLTAQMIQQFKSGTTAGKTLDPEQGDWRGLNEFYQATMLQHEFSHLTRLKSQNNEVPLQNFLLLKSKLRQYANAPEEISSMGLVVSLVNIVSGIYFQMPEFRESTRDLSDFWEKMVTRLLSSAPNRTDLVIPYFNFLVSSGMEQKAHFIAVRILESNPDDAVANWFVGLVQLGIKNQESQGIVKMRKALSLGIQNLMPVSPDIISILNEGQ